MLSMNQWEIYEAEVPYAEDPSQSSWRPVLMINPCTFLVLKMTTHQHSEKPKPYEYEIMKWREAGLTAKTFVQCDRFIKLSPGMFTGKCYGRLQTSDVIGVKVMMKYHGLVK